MSNTSENRGKNHINKHKKKSSKKVILISLSVIALLILGLLASGLGYTYSLLGKMDRVELNKANLGINETLPESKGIQNIALFGIDATDGDIGRSDSIMILTIDKDRDKLKVSSIMRDSYVPIEGHKQDKLNHAYAFGGPELAIKTLNQNFNLNISDFVSVNFSSLPKIIDQLGGIELNLTKDELKYINHYIDKLNDINKTNVGHLTEPGKQQVNGTQALAYCRIRYTNGGDYERTHRHRIILTALFDKFKSTSPTNYPTILNQLLPYVKTNLSANNILGSAMNIAKMSNLKLQQERFPSDNLCEGKFIGPIWYLTFNKDATVKQINNFIFEDINPNNNIDTSSIAK